MYKRIDTFPNKSRIYFLNFGGTMKRLILILLTMVLTVGLSAGEVGSDCTFKGKKLAGKVQFVTSFPDFKVQIVDSFPDLKVKKVTSFPSDCGQWQEVTSFPDFKVQIVTSFPDFKVKYVDSFPGVP
jgi:hypothetical protein